MKNPFRGSYVFSAALILLALALPFAGYVFAADSTGQGTTGSTLATVSTSASDAKSTVVSAWFDGLSTSDQKKFLAEAARQGLVARSGKAFTPGQFASMANFVDEELTRQGLSADDKHNVLQRMQQRAGIQTPAEIGSRD